jgi:hypothetical protein
VVAGSGLDANASQRRHDILRDAVGRQHRSLDPLRRGAHPDLGRFAAIVDTLGRAGFTSPLTKYLVYYDGPIDDDNICGQGGSDGSGFGVAVVYYRSCAGVSTAAVAAHEFLHDRAVPSAAPNDCPGDDSGHTCDDQSDLMYPAIGGEPLSAKVLDPGRNDYYGHSGAWLDAGLGVARASRQPGAARARRLGDGHRDRRRARPAVLGELRDDLERGAGARPDRDAWPWHEARPLERCVLGERRLQRHGRARGAGLGALRSGDVSPDGLGRWPGHGSKLPRGDQLPSSLLRSMQVLVAVRSHVTPAKGGAPLVERRLPGREEDLPVPMSAVTRARATFARS